MCQSRHDDIALAIGMFCIIAMTCTVVVVKVEWHQWQCWGRAGAGLWHPAARARAASTTVRWSAGPRPTPSPGAPWCWSPRTGPTRWRRSPWSRPGTDFSTSGWWAAATTASSPWSARWCPPTPGAWSTRGRRSSLRRLGQGDHPKRKMLPRTSSFYFLNHDKSIQHLLVFFFPIHFAHGRDWFQSSVQNKISSNKSVSRVSGRAAGGPGPEGGGLHQGRRQRVDKPLQQEQEPSRDQNCSPR